MKAVQMDKPGTFTVREVPDLEPGEYVLVRTQAAGICGTELHILDAMIEPPWYPFVLGHEAAGIVEHVPSGTPGVEVGDRVAVYNFIGCGTCLWCRTGRQEVCVAPVGQLGFSLDGTFRDVIPVPAQCLVQLPDEVSFETAALLSCSGMTAVHATRMSGVRLGQTVVVDGVGGVGLMVIQAAVAAGARAIAIADAAAKADLAHAAGAADVIVLDESGYQVVADRIRELTGGAGSDHFFELVGTTASMLAGIRGLGRHGSAVIIGYTGDDLVINPVELILSETRVLGSVAADKQDLQTAVDLAARRQLSAQIDTRYGIDEVGTGLDRLRKRQVNGRNVLVW